MIKEELKEKLNQELQLNFDDDNFHSWETRLNYYITLLKRTGKNIYTYDYKLNEFIYTTYFYYKGHLFNLVIKKDPVFNLYSMNAFMDGDKIYPCDFFDSLRAYYLSQYLS